MNLKADFRLGLLVIGEADIINLMSLEAVAEFPFVETLTKRQQGRLTKAVEVIRRMRDDDLLPASVAAKVLGVGIQRVYDLQKQGRFSRVELHGQVFVKGADVVAYAAAERKTGHRFDRTSYGEQWAASVAFAKEVCESTK